MTESQLIQNTKAYKTVSEEQKNNCLSHAYLIVLEDEGFLTTVLTEFAKLIMQTSNAENNKRIQNLIEKQSYVDVSFFPKQGEDKVTAEQVTEMIADTYIKPYEADKKLYVFLNGHKLSATVQNKLLKTLEEPSNNVCILIGTCSEFSILQTVKSRVKKLVIPPFSNSDVLDVLSNTLTDYDRLKIAVQNSGGYVGKAKQLYADQDLKPLEGLVTEILVDMKSTADITKYTARIVDYKENLTTFLDLLENRLNAMQQIIIHRDSSGLDSANYVLKNGERYNIGSLIWAINAVEKAREMLYFNTNETMVIEGLLFSILEGKYKWQKL